MSTPPINASKNRLKAIQADKQQPAVRIKNFDEVVLGYTEEQALSEASRCLKCREPKCVTGCPVGVDIPGFIGFIQQKNYDAAIDKIKERNSLPAICGRVCPQEEQCQKTCILGIRGEPISIGRLERFAADLEQKKQLVASPIKGLVGKKVAVVGAGPAGLTVAADLAKLGYSVTIFEALHCGGGVLVYGIPEFRLPKRIVQSEIDNITKLGVEFRSDALIGRLFTIDELFANGYQAVFIGTGAGLPKFLGVPGENLNGIYSANEFLIRANLMKSYDFPKSKTPIKVGKKVAVIGGGNVALDSARCAIRLGAQEVAIIYRRTRDQMPARQEEIENADEEGIVFRYLTSPIKFNGDQEGNVKSMETISMKLCEDDNTERRNVTPIEGSQTVMDVDTVIIAIGRTPNPIIQGTTPGLKTERDGIITNDTTFKTSLDGVYVGGDIATGEATVISAMGTAKIAAKSIHEYLSNPKNKT
ncbi:MAG: NADPH-dependent glutamate synthase [Nitrososphaerota archaeon]|jgi:glutamate synthase (NADPH/NADH) small chain|uniref:NADPH-dependent glutamate synthase n=1 Tax=Candidatus Bathycorpusculum sp. TaxID=2994959 RepID=UPI002824ABBC|nr:NADPH-dependent glutamate synthase [Candidatus Termitimicrobium sp.]MCL2432324.1 NADPH-dependent glutamate synthase [Candidatus Termitimicrobium sp.]MDR0493193.1 NADPH-dependent glutamate synthase [Nitrososphaerota archaeon]